MSLTPDTRRYDLANEEGIYRGDTWQWAVKFTTQAVDADGKPTGPEQNYNLTDKEIKLYLLKKMTDTTPFALLTIGAGITVDLAQSTAYFKLLDTVTKTATEPKYYYRLYVRDPATNIVETWLIGEVPANGEVPGVSGS